MSELTAPIEVTTKYVTSVKTLREAWAFVMEHVDSLGDRPTIQITPKTIYGFDQIADGEGSGEELFEVLVSGMRAQS